MMRAAAWGAGVFLAAAAFAAPKIENASQFLPLVLLLALPAARCAAGLVGSPPCGEIVPYGHRLSAGRAALTGALAFGVLSPLIAGLPFGGVPTAAERPAALALLLGAAPAGALFALVHWVLVGDADAEGFASVAVGGLLGAAFGGAGAHLLAVPVPSVLTSLGTLVGALTGRILRKEELFLWERSLT